MTIKQLEKKLIELEGKVSTFTKSRSTPWLVMAGAGLVLIIILWLTVFRNKGGNADKKIEDLQTQIEHLKKSNAFIDSLIKEKDTLYIENRKTENKVKTRYEQIPERVRDLSRDELDRELSKYDY